MIVVLADLYYICIMNEVEIKKALITAARSKDICVPGYERMLSSNIDGLVDYYLEVPDWCMERSFPSYVFLKENFSDCGDKGVFVGRTFHGELLNERQAYVFHRCRGTIKVGLNVAKAIIPMLYIANGCKLHIVGVGDMKPRKASERSAVPVYIFGKNDVSAKDNKYVTFTCYSSELRQN